MNCNPLHPQIPTPSPARSLRPCLSPSSRNSQKDSRDFGGPICHTTINRRKKSEGTSIRVELQLTNALCYQAFNAINMNQYHTAPQATPYTSAYTSAYMTAPPRYPDANTYGDMAATWHMVSTNDMKASQTDGQHVNTIEGDHVTDKEKEWRYVVWGESGSL